ncbi:hypothetical protein G7072_10190 [Nocardioides sp. HDW12B]|uniref:hypothetical protein n=1 Tax=Nocardioides sp. HDW12B TaxID=2714939 RepID=UPI00140B4140|nr:hypothetical protein [Nocardioides sp. HDW12B]QIK66659.1 hypothetical protein G7072_10190 [Nocardioides sp. HDW12B]
MTSNPPDSSSPSPAASPDGPDGMDDYPGNSPDAGRVEAEEMDGDSDGGDSRQQG